MRPDVLIAGQGLAGTLLGWEFERAGLAFAVADDGHAHAATLAAAGIINPITGRRLVKSWRIDTLFPAARAVYGELGEALGMAIWRELRVRRLFADGRERAALAQKEAGGVLAPFAGPGDAEGFWIAPAAGVDLAALLAGMRERWRQQNRLRPGPVRIEEELRQHELVVDCRGLATAREGGFGFVPWEFSRGERLEIAVAGLEPDVVINRRHWVLPVGPGAAWVGATHEPGVKEAAPTVAAREALTASAMSLLKTGFSVTGQRTGVRVHLPDKLPAAGRHPEQAGLGLINGLGGKGALWAPFLARQWREHLVHGTCFDPEIDVQRFARSTRAAAPGR